MSKRLRDTYHSNKNYQNTWCPKYDYNNKEKKSKKKRKDKNPYKKMETYSYKGMVFDKISIYITNNLKIRSENERIKIKKTNPCIKDFDRMR